jgi:hypothetical protein
LLMKGKNKMQALGAAMRKLVHQCFGVLKHQTELRKLVHQCFGVLKHQTEYCQQAI